MEIPTHCPKCNDPLLNKYSLINEAEICNKSCKLRPDHQFVCVVDEKLNRVSSVSMTLSINPLIRIGWQFDHKRIDVFKGTLEEIIKSNQDMIDSGIPWFEPNFSNYSKLLKKVKTYVLFS